MCDNLSIEESLQIELKEWMKKYNEYLIRGNETLKNVRQERVQGFVDLQKIVSEKLDNALDFPNFSECLCSQEQHHWSADICNKFIEDKINNKNETNANIITKLEQNANYLKQEVDKLISEDHIVFEPYHKLETINASTKLEGENISKQLTIFVNEMQENIKEYNEMLLELKKQISVLGPIEKKLRDDIYCCKTSVKELLNSLGLNSTKDANADSFQIMELESEIEEMEYKISTIETCP